jgi:hypothetical protein
MAVLNNKPMTPKEKAKQLVDKYIALTDGWVYGISNWEHKKKCALIAVDESEKSEYNVLIKFGFVTENYKSDYWQQVKTEIENL